MAELNSSPVINLTSGARVEPSGQGISGMGASGLGVSGVGAAKSGDGAQGFAQMMAGAIQARSNAQSAMASGQDGQKSGTVNFAKDLIKSLQAKISALLGQSSLPADVSATLTELQNQLSSLAQSIETQTTISGASGQSVLKALVGRLQKIGDLLDQNQDMTMASSWAGQLQAAVAGLLPAQRSTPTAGAGQESEATGKPGRSVPAGMTGLAHVQTMAGARLGGDQDGSMPAGASVAGGTIGQGANTTNTIAASIGGQMAGQGEMPQAVSAQANNPNGDKAVNNLVQASVLAADDSNKKTDEVMKFVRNADLNTSSASISSANYASSVTAPQMAQTNSPLPTLPGVLDLNQPKLADNMGQQIQWMLGKNMSRATLELNPAQLGPLKITIDMQQNQMHIQVFAAHHLTRDVLEQSLPRLREFLQDAGLGNAQVSVGPDNSQSQGQSAHQGQLGNSGGRSANGHGSSDMASVAATVSTATVVEPSITTTWRLDTFA